MAKKTMTASASMTDGQITTAIAAFRAALEKHRSDFPLDATQEALGTPNLGMVLLAPFRTLVEAVSGYIIRRVPVNRKRSNEEALKATGRKLYVNHEVVKTMPRGEGEEAETVFFKPKMPERGYLTNDEAKKEFEIRDLEPEFPDNLAAQNEADPAFADESPNCTIWKDANGNWCYATFYHFLGGRSVFVYRRDNYWRGYWSFAGRRKRQPSALKT